MTRSTLLILGGTTEASALCRVLSADPAYAPILSLAGRTRNPVLPPVPSRIGGFGGIAGLVSYLREHRVACLIDATHPFAAQISRHAVAAASSVGIPLLTISRPPWSARPGDRWRAVPDLTAAAVALGRAPRRVFLTIGQQELAAFADQPQHHYLVRSVDRPAVAFLPPHATMITARGPFDEQAEIALLRTHRIEMLVTKNSGGDATYAKLAAARHLSLPVVMVDRPKPPDGVTVPDIAAALAWLAHHGGSNARGV